MAARARRGDNSKRTLFVTHPHCAEHRIAHHPEQPKRVEAIEAAVLAHFGERSADFAHDPSPPDATAEALGRFHTVKMQLLASRSPWDAHRGAKCSSWSLGGLGTFSRQPKCSKMQFRFSRRPGDAPVRSQTVPTAPGGP